MKILCDFKKLFNFKSQCRHKYFRNFSSDQRAFSLMEVAIALVIAGLIISMAFKGHSLIENAKLQNTIAEINAFRMELIDVDVTQLCNNTKFDKNASLEVWQKLRQLGVNVKIENSCVTTKIGGMLGFAVNVAGVSGAWFVLSGVSGGGIINFEKANKLKQKYTSNDDILLVNEQLQQVTTPCENKVLLAFKI